MNIVALTGRFTTNPELKTTQSGVSVTSFCLAVDRKYQPSGEEKKTDFIDFVAWRNHAEFITKYFRKGSMIGIEGEIQTRTFEDKNGNKRKTTEVVVSHVSFCGSRVENSSGDNQPSGEDQLAALSEALNNTEFAEVDDESDLPF
jgi:single-strand DNA-binding protein